VEALQRGTGEDALAVRLVVAGDDLEVIGATAQRLASERPGVPVTCVRIADSPEDSSELGARLCIRSFPTGFLVKQDGTIACTSYELGGWSRFLTRVREVIGPGVPR
jgi:hypothetical protein